MRKDIFTCRSVLPASTQEAFAWHTRPATLDRLIPPWEDVQLVRRTGGVADGGQVELRVRLAGIPVTWLAEHRDCQPPVQFRDVQLRGPFASWDHVHRFESAGPDSSYLEDQIEYALRGGMLGRVLGSALVRRRLERLFHYRHATTIADLAAHAKYKGEPLDVCVSGSSGLIGSALAVFLAAGGHRVRRLVRRPAQTPEDIFWDPSSGTVDADKLEGCDAVVHLAGENPGAGRWTQARKAAIFESRVQATRKLCEAISRLRQPPKVLVCASAIGFYGDRGDRVLDEDDRPGDGFLPDLCRQWEAASEPAAQRGIRVVSARFGIVLSPRSGALARMLPLFRWGLGGRLASGQQFWSWIMLDDAVGAIHQAMITPSLAGPMNVTTPNPVRNAEFAQTLAAVLRRPAVLPAPAWALRLALGPMADEMLLASARALPRRLFASGYVFRQPTLEQALRHVLGRG